MKRLLSTAFLVFGLLALQPAAAQSNFEIWYGAILEVTRLEDLLLTRSEEDSARIWHTQKRAWSVKAINEGRAYLGPTMRETDKDAIVSFHVARLYFDMKGFRAAKQYYERCQHNPRAWSRTLGEGDDNLAAMSAISITACNDSIAAREASNDRP